MRCTFCNGPLTPMYDTRGRNGGRMIGRQCANRTTDQCRDMNNALRKGDDLVAKTKVEPDQPAQANVTPFRPAPGTGTLKTPPRPASEARYEM